MSLLLLTLFAQDPCLSFGGKSVMLTREDTHAQVVLCNIGEEQVAMETLESESAGTQTQVIDHFLSDEVRLTFTDPGGWIIQPSYGYCAMQLKGTGIRAIREDGAQDGLCLMEDGSLISDWTMYRGKAHARKADLYELIKRLRHLPGALNTEEPIAAQWVTDCIDTSEYKKSYSSVTIAMTLSESGEYQAVYSLYSDRECKIFIRPDTYTGKWKETPFRASYTFNQGGKDYSVNTEGYRFMDFIESTGNSTVFFKIFPDHSMSFLQRWLMTILTKPRLNFSATIIVKAAKTVKQTLAPTLNFALNSD